MACLYGTYIPLRSRRGAHSSPSLREIACTPTPDSSPVGRAISAHRAFLLAPSPTLDPAEALRHRLPHRVRRYSPLVRSILLLCLEGVVPSALARVARGAYQGRACRRVVSEPGASQTHRHLFPLPHRLPRHRTLAPHAARHRGDAHLAGKSPCNLRPPVARPKAGARKERQPCRCPCPFAQVYAGGATSGAHYNPAVSVGVLVRSRNGGAAAFSAGRCCGYVLAQLLAAVAASGAAYVVLGGRTPHPPSTHMPMPSRVSMT